MLLDGFEGWLIVLIAFVSKILVDSSLGIGGDDVLRYRPINVVGKNPRGLTSPPGSFRFGIDLIVPDDFVKPPTAFTQVVQTVSSQVQFGHYIGYPYHFRMPGGFKIQFFGPLIKDKINGDIRR